MHFVAAGVSRRTFGQFCERSARTHVRGYVYKTGSKRRDSVGTMITQPYQPTNTPRKRRLWLWISLGCVLGLFLLIGAGIFALAAYGKHLISTYTVTQPQALPAVDTSPAAMARLKAKWKNFVGTLNDAQAAPQPLQLSNEEINQFFSQVPALKDTVRARMEGNQLKGQFSVPLDNTKQSRLKGRYFCGEATFNLQFEAGFPTLTLASLQANGKPLPHWLVSKIGAANLVEALDKDINAKEVMAHLKNIEVRDGSLVLVPEHSPHAGQQGF